MPHRAGLCLARGTTLTEDRLPRTRSHYWHLPLHGTHLLSMSYPSLPTDTQIACQILSVGSLSNPGELTSRGQSHNDNKTLFGNLFPWEDLNKQPFVISHQRQTKVRLSELMSLCARLQSTVSSVGDPKVATPLGALIPACLPILPQSHRWSPTSDNSLWSLCSSTF